MSDIRQFIAVMIVAALFVSWLGWRGFTVVELNEKLRQQSALADYPYPFRVLRVEGDTAVMSTLRSTRIDTALAMRELFPDLERTPATSPDLLRAEQEYARLQAQASKTVTTSPGIQRVRWELDENWYYLNDMATRRGPGSATPMNPAAGG
ncbi:hypothetical protein [Salicola sp. Rm-C-2C1-2]|uniref:hypothetical protein n=1 Tax=Salicola sp. Rm-C-2C1-2 TaxID=3141321 RepID=UPI0032E44B29